MLRSTALGQVVTPTHEDIDQLGFSAETEHRMYGLRSSTHKNALKLEYPLMWKKVDTRVGSWTEAKNPKGGRQKAKSKSQIKVQQTMKTSQGTKAGTLAQRRSGTWGKGSTRALSHFSALSWVRLVMSTLWWRGAGIFKSNWDTCQRPLHRAVQWEDNVGKDKQMHLIVLALFMYD